MRLSYKRFLGILGLLYIVITPCSGQDAETDEGRDDMAYVQILTSAVFPNALGNNFLSEAYAVKAGFMGELSIFFDERYFIGYQGIFNSSEVENPALVGQFDRSKIQHHYLQSGYSFLPKEHKIGITTAIGVGLARYKNFKEDTKFLDDGFSLMANARLSYRFSSFLGLHTGLQLSNDFMNTKTAPELESFFKNAHTLYVSAGLVFYIGAN